MAMRQQPLRLLADDLTGALDSAAAFASPSQPIPVCWRGKVPARGAIAIDSRSREASPEHAQALVRKIAPALWPPGAGLAFKKVDSLLRGQEATELAAVLDLLRPTHCIIAPAFPAQQRTTRAGRQYAYSGDSCHIAPVDIAAELARAGHYVTLVKPGEGLPPGVSLWDAESDADLDAVVAAAGDQEILWVGAGGLAAALARAAGLERPARSASLLYPVLGLIGSEHTVTRAQLTRLGPSHRQLESANTEHGEIRRRLAERGVVFVTVDVPRGTERPTAAAHIEQIFAALLASLDRPGTIVVAGGETLRGICDALGADRLEVTGDIVPGVPHSTMRGGQWDALAVVSKSGAFGGPDLLAELVQGGPHAGAGAAA